MKKIVIALSVLMVVMIAIYFVWPTKQKELAIESVPAVNEFPNMMLTLPDGSHQNARSLEGKSILILYFPDCDHCQREALEISTRLKAFENYDLWFLTTDPFSKMDKFANDYKLNDQPNVHFAQITFEDVAAQFGGIATPSVYIYSESKKLIKAINGETPVDQIIMYL
jgi:peroxiredoxin